MSHAAKVQTQYLASRLCNKTCDETTRIKVQHGEIDSYKLSDVSLTNNYDSKILTEFAVVCANNVSVDMQQVI